ncbi:MAG: LamG-like jellyroll fold domain-containing protein [Planctomycetota bacterium]|jgi:hypothetical protein
MRKLFTLEEIDNLHLLYEKAEKLAENDPKVLSRIRHDKSFLLYTDMSKRNPGSGAMSKKELALFKDKLSEYLNITQGRLHIRSRMRRNIRKNKESARGWFWRVARLKIKGKVIKEDPVFKQILNDPQSLDIAEYKRPEVELLPDAKGWKIPLELSMGARFREKYNYECPLRNNIRILRTRATDYFLMRMNFSLPDDPGKCVLAIEGQDDDKKGTTSIRIEVNGKNIFIGKNKFPEHNWATVKYELPEGLLKKGDNEIVVEDTEEGANYFAQWVMVSNVSIETEKPVKGPPAETLFHAKYDKSLDAEIGSAKEHYFKGKVKLSKNGKWGGAFDAGYTEKLHGALWYDSQGNFNVSKGTIDMWVKTNWKVSDSGYNTFCRVMNTTTRKGGIILCRYSKTPKLLSLNTNDGTTVTGDISNWKSEEWHHIAVTWDETAGKKQLFVDGILIGSGKFKTRGEMNRIIVGSLTYKAAQSIKYGACALIDEFRITNDVLWRGEKRGQKVFDLPEKPDGN